MLGRSFVTGGLSVKSQRSRFVLVPDVMATALPKSCSDNWGSSRASLRFDLHVGGPYATRAASSHLVPTKL